MLQPYTSTPQAIMPPMGWLAWPRAETPFQHSTPPSSAEVRAEVELGYKLGQPDATKKRSPHSTALLSSILKTPTSIGFEATRSAISDATKTPLPL